MTRIWIVSLVAAAAVFAAACGGDDSGGGNPATLTPTVSPGPPTGLPGVIAFVSDRDGNAEIYLMNADGSDPTNLTKNPASDSGPSWLPRPASSTAPADGERP